jgi:H+/Cl- antiporter ClcA
MNKITSVAFLVLGIILLFFGFSAYHSASSHVSRFFTGAPTDKALWLLIGGVVAGIVGFLGLARK